MAEKGGFIWALHQMMSGKGCYIEGFDFEHCFYIDGEGVLVGDNGVPQHFDTDMLTYTWVLKENCE